MWHCYYCRTPLSLEVQKRNRLCPTCGSDIHCCRNCIRYDQTLSSKCKEPNSPWLNDRTSANECEYFEPGTSATEESSASDAEKAKEAFRALFRNV